jgi:hypothetical protein
MDWTALPYELEDVVLGNLSLRQLADVSPTCQRFDQIIRQKLAKEQNSRCDLAISRFGRERVDRIADITHSFLNAHSSHSQSVKRAACSWSISDDGALHIAPASHPARHSRGVRDDFWYISEDGKVHSGEAAGIGTAGDVLGKGRDVSVWVSLVSYPATLHVEVSWRDGLGLNMTFGPVKGPFGVSLRPCSDEDVIGMALVQGLLSANFAPSVSEGCRRPEVHISWSDSNQGFTSVGLETLIAPLLPLAQTYRVTEWAGFRMVKERREERQTAGSASRMIDMHISLVQWPEAHVH